MRFSSVLADLAMWLWIGLLRKEAEWQVVLLWVAPSVAGEGKVLARFSPTVTPEEIGEQLSVLTQT
jgi:hypothetical protein